MPDTPSGAPVRRNRPAIRAARYFDYMATAAAQNNGGTANLRPFRKGVSGNPGGRPKGLAKATREVVGEDGRALAELWWSIASDPARKDSDRLEASRLLADRGWGKAPTFAAVEEADPLDLEELELAAEKFRADVLRLAALKERPA